MKSIVIIGFQGSGKSEIARCLGEKRKIQIIEFGDALKKIYKENESKKKLISFANNIFKHKKESIICNEALQSICTNSQVIVFVGIRTKRELYYIKKNVDIDLVVGISCKFVKRFYRRKKQKKKSDGFIQRELCEKWWRRGTYLFDECDIVVNNNKNGAVNMIKMLKKMEWKNE